MSRKFTQEWFIQLSNEIHNNQYDYSMVEYKRHKDKVTIICHLHGKFDQLPQNHLKGHGCTRCGLLTRKHPIRVTTAQFIEKAVRIHNNRYDYSKVDYKSAKEKITIICKEHGSFSQKPNDHLSNHGCPTCGGIESNRKISHSSRVNAGNNAAKTAKKNGSHLNHREKLQKFKNNLSPMERQQHEMQRIKKYRESKTASGKMIPYSNRELYHIYQRAVAIFTSRSLKESNLENYDKKGPIEKGGWHVDHQLSQRDGFLLNIPPYIIGSIHNLMMLPGLENCKKNYRSWITPEELFERYFNQTGGARE